MKERACLDPRGGSMPQCVVAQNELSGARMRCRTERAERRVGVMTCEDVLWGRVLKLATIYIYIRTLNTRCITSQVDTQFRLQSLNSSCNHFRPFWGVVCLPRFCFLEEEVGHPGGGSSRRLFLRPFFFAIAGPLTLVH